MKAMIPSTMLIQQLVAAQSTPSATQLAAQAARGLEWVPASGGKSGYWRGIRMTGGPKVSVSHRTVDEMTDAEAAAHRARTDGERHRKVCIATGMPLQLVPLCAEGLAAGATMEEIITRLQEEGVPPDVAAAAAAAATAPRKSKLLLYGGIGAAGVILFLLLRKKKSS